MTTALLPHAFARVDRATPDEIVVQLTGRQSTGHADRLAGAVPIGGGLAPADLPGFWEAIAPNFADLPILNVWGARDSVNVPGLASRPTTDTIASINRRFQKFAAQHAPGVVNIQIPRKGHEWSPPPPGDLTALLPAWRRTVGASVLAGLPAPVLSTSLAHVEALGTAVLPIAVVQAQRDRFGAHGFGWADRGGVHHGPWASPDQEDGA